MTASEIVRLTTTLTFQILYMCNPGHCVQQKKPSENRTFASSQNEFKVSWIRYFKDTQQVETWYTCSAKHSRKVSQNMTFVHLTVKILIMIPLNRNYHSNIPSSTCDGMIRIAWIWGQVLVAIRKSCTGWIQGLAHFRGTIEPNETSEQTWIVLRYQFPLKSINLTNFSS